MCTATGNQCTATNSRVRRDECSATRATSTLPHSADGERAEAMGAGAKLSQGGLCNAVRHPNCVSCNVLQHAIHSASVPIAPRGYATNMVNTATHFEKPPHPATPRKTLLWYCPPPPSPPTHRPAPSSINFHHLYLHHPKTLMVEFIHGIFD